MRIRNHFLLPLLLAAVAVADAQPAGTAAVAIRSKSPSAATQWLAFLDGNWVDTGLTNASSDMAVAIDRDGDVYLAARENGSNALKLRRYKLAANTWDGGWATLAGPWKGNPALEVRGGTLYLAANAPAGAGPEGEPRLWIGRLAGGAATGSWTPLGRNLLSDPFVAATPCGDIYVGGSEVNQSRTIASRRYAERERAWKNWTGHGGVTAGAPAAASGGDCHLYVTVRDPQGAAWLLDVHADNRGVWQAGGGIFAPGTELAVAREGDGVAVAGLARGGNSARRSFAKGKWSAAKWDTGAPFSAPFVALGAARSGPKAVFVGLDKTANPWWFDGNSWTLMGNPDVPAQTPAGRMSAGPR